MKNVAVFGAGRIGRIHASNLAALPGVQLKYVCDAMPAAAADLAQTLGAEVDFGAQGLGQVCGGGGHGVADVLELHARQGGEVGGVDAANAAGTEYGDVFHGVAVWVKGWNMPDLWTGAERTIKTFSVIEKFFL